MIKRINSKHFIALILLVLQLFIFSLSFNAFSSINLIATATNKVKEDKLTTAKGMATIEVSTGRLLYAKDENKRLPMASTTKVLTAIVAIESGKDLDEKHEIPAEAVGIEGSSIYLRKGEHLSLRELLYGLMLRSGNDSAVAIAIIVAGSVENFVGLMNSYCEKLGLKDTHIVTVNGLHDDEHYTTAFELAKITAYALKNPTFAEIVKTQEKKIDNELGKKEKYRFLKNKNKLLRNLNGANGVKTGYTKKAGRCFVGSAKRGDMEVVSVVLDCGPMFEETTALIEKAFAEYKMYKLFSAGELTKLDGNAEDEKISVNLNNDIILPLTESEYSKVIGKLEIENLELKSSPEPQNIGELKIELENNLIFSEKVFTIYTKEKTNFIDNLKKIIEKF